MTPHHDKITDTFAPATFKETATAIIDLLTHYLTTSTTIEYRGAASESRSICRIRWPDSRNKSISVVVYPETLRRVSYVDLEKNKRYVYLTNIFTVSAITVADIYKKHWQVELFFRWINHI